MAEEDLRSFEYTPTWVIAAICFIIVFISLLAERGLHHLGKCLKHGGQDALYEAVQKLKEGRSWCKCVSTHQVPSEEMLNLLEQTILDTVTQ